MKSTFLKAIKAIALSLALTVGASGLVFANGAGAPTTKVALNGGGNGAGGGTRSKRGKRVVKRVSKRKAKQTA